MRRKDLDFRSLEEFRFYLLLNEYNYEVLSLDLEDSYIDVSGYESSVCRLYIESNPNVLKSLISNSV